MLIRKDKPNHLACKNKQFGFAGTQTTLTI